MVWLGTCPVRLILVHALLLLALCGVAGTTDVSRDNEVQLPTGLGLAAPVGQGSPRNVTISYDFVSRLGAPVVVLAYDDEIWYVDSDTFEVIAKNTYPNSSRVVVSDGGEFVAVVTEIENRRTNKILRKIRVEDWKGRRLWERDAEFLSRFEPTPTGGLVVYPSSPDWLGQELTPRQMRTVPEPRSHGVLVYGREGNLLLEGVGHDEFRFGGRGVVSADGSQLAFIYQWIPPQNRNARSPETEDRACLVLFDIEKGVELWRHYFQGVRPGYLAVSTGAERIVCFASTPGVWPASNFTMFLFDGTGSLVDKQQLASSEEDFWPQIPVLSPNGRFCAFTANKSRVFLVDLSDGQVLWDIDRPANMRYASCLSVNNEGSVLLEMNRRKGSLTVIERVLLVVSARGTRMVELRDDAIRLDDTIWAGYSAEDGSSLWLVHGEQMVSYVVTSEPSERGGSR